MNIVGLPSENSTEALLPLSVEQEVEQLLSYAQRKFGQDQLVQAKEDFFWLMGRVFHDDDFYEERMTYFLDIYLFERPLRRQASAQNSPLFIYRADSDVSPIGIYSFRHSLFQVTKVEKNTLFVDDLLEGQPLIVTSKPGEHFSQMTTKQIFQGFIYRSARGNELSRGLIYHPSGVNSLILKSVRIFQSDLTLSFSKVLGLLAKNHLRHLRQDHLDPKRIYAETYETPR